MTDFEGLMLFLALLLLVLSAVFLDRWVKGKVNDAVGIFAIGGIVSALMIPIVVTPDAFKESVRGVLGLAKEVSKEIGQTVGEGANQSMRASVFGKNADRSWWDWFTGKESKRGGSSSKRR